ncbi:hypothetical protein OXPF_09810 [Oxobacter pfennigii]|uniref:Peptidase S54 rhomboid domain-containing protein n=1 Tax=Oxobacter pfennigii TaxID=36849 RepID=A0A0P9AK50_9CLOT|nr:rhomboid family intramembrane serine protease [Oxobacter pfennigii]KPU45747.1 hypothetical protein OXPF_09810 [Oxobacter pfennigii]
MKWLDNLERKYGRYSIRNLTMYIVGLNGAVFLLMLFNNSIVSKLMLIPSMVLRGEVWRLITYILIPPSASVLFIFFTLYFYYMVGTALEQSWGSFRLNVYYLIGMLGTTIAAFITGAGTTGVYLNLSLFLAFAQLYPNFEILVFFILPVKIKYLAWLNWVYIAYTVLIEPVHLKLAAIVSVINFFIFFWDDIIQWYKMKRMVYKNRKRFFDEVNKGKDRWRR